MTEPSRLEAAQNAQRESGGEWYRSPLALVAGIILFVGILAVLVLSFTGGDDSAADVSTTSDTAAALADPISFGGTGVLEVDTVMVAGDALPRLGDGADEAIGMLAPDVTASSLANGNPIVLDAGKARVIGFFAHWCPHCQDELPQITTWLGENELPPNTEFIAVSTVVDEGRGNYPPSDWFNEVGWPAPVVVDDERATLLSTYGFSGFPAFIAIDSSGTVVARESGNIGIEGLERLLSNFAS